MKQILVLGNIGNPAQLRVTADGKQLVTFSIAVNNRDKSTTWFSIVGRASEQLLPYLSKGRQVFVMGDLEVKLYNGNIDLSVFADRIELCGKGDNDTQEAHAPTPQDNAGNKEPGTEESKDDVY